MFLHSFDTLWFLDSLSWTKTHRILLFSTMINLIKTLRGIVCQLPSSIFDFVITYFLSLELVSDSISWTKPHRILLFFTLHQTRLIAFTISLPLSTQHGLWIWFMFLTLITSLTYTSVLPWKATLYCYGFLSSKSIYLIWVIQTFDLCTARVSRICSYLPIHLYWIVDYYSLYIHLIL